MRGAAWGWREAWGGTPVDRPATSLNLLLLSSFSFTAGPTALAPPAASALAHDAWLEWEERVLRPAAVGGAPAADLEAALATLARAVGGADAGAAHLSGGPEPALADVAVFFTLAGEEEVRD